MSQIPSPDRETTFRRMLRERGPASRPHDIVPPAPESKTNKLGPVVTDGTITTYEIVTDSDGRPTAFAETVERLGFTDSGEK